MPPPHTAFPEKPNQHVHTTEDHYSTYKNTLDKAQTAKDDNIKDLISQIFRKKKNKNSQHMLDKFRKPNYAPPQKMSAPNPLNLSAYHRKIQFQNGSGEYRVLYGN